MGFGMFGRGVFAAHQPSGAQVFENSVGAVSMGVSALGVNLGTDHSAFEWSPRSVTLSAPVSGVRRRRTVGLHRRLRVDDLVQNVIGVVAPRSYSVVGFSR